ncbi:probable glycerol-3-phosphate acyltransferase 3 [Olea europaea subsp. europaea]|uniref:Probable glycerol-3-phosphate acyltransferase 3 n=1 Tax=Olea europaea subsp. europaea TaxID=158383 RepID=A0A8S0REV1_OLEEU|nr:probable glycerol-3-phosphate acyltransferase 3 [Olea europaea subsp. europaea]
MMVDSPLADVFCHIVYGYHLVFSFATLGCLLPLQSSCPDLGLYRDERQNSRVPLPLKSIRLVRGQEKDLKMMGQILCHGNIVACPEGTTCWEPCLLRFSPLFAELSDHIIPVALDSEVSTFYGATASGRKTLDPLLFLLNPRAVYTVNFLPKSYACSSGESSKIEWLIMCRMR